MTGTRMNQFRPGTARVLLLAALCAFATTTARAADATLQGDRLALTTTGDIAANILSDNSLGGAVRVTGEDLSCLTAHGGQTVEISTAGCGSDIGNLTILVPPGFPVALLVQGDGDVHISDVGPLSATLTSDGGLTVGRSRDLILSLHGDGDASVSAVDGTADVRITGSGGAKLLHVGGILHAILNGSGDLAVTSISAPAADIATAGSGEISIGEGNISALRASTNGSGDITVAAHVDAADLQASGGGDMKLANVTGVVKRSATGGSSIHIGGSAMDLDSLRNLKIPPIPPIPPIPALPTINLSTDDWPDQSSHHSSHGFAHFIAGILVLVLIYFIWRAVQRRGMPNFATPTGSATTASHPGVLAIRDTLSRLEGRLAQVETYVTSREFDLQRKFRDLDMH